MLRSLRKEPLILLRASGRGHRVGDAWVSPERCLGIFWKDIEGAGSFLKISKVQRQAILKAKQPYGGVQSSPGNPKQNAPWRAEEPEGADASPSTGPATVFGPRHHESTTAGSRVMG